MMSCAFRRLAMRLPAGLAATFLLAAQPALAAPYGPYAQTPGQAAVAAALDGAASPADVDRAAMLASIDVLPTAAERADALGQLSQRSYALLPRLAVTSMDAYDAAIRSELVERRSIAADAPAGVLASGDRTINVLLSGGLTQASFDGSADRQAANMDGRAFRFALDFRPIRNLTLGATIGIDNMDASLDLSQHPRITLLTTYLGPYASYNNGRFYLDLSGGYQLSEQKLLRQVRWTGFDDQLRTDLVEGDGWAMTGELGGLLRVGGLRLQPFAGVQYRYADVSGFTEHGGPAALDVAQYNTESVRSSLGARASGTMNRGKWAIRLTLEGRWQHELQPRPDSRIEARFATRDLDVFTLQPTPLARDAGQLGAGVTATANSRTSVRVGFTGDYASDHHVNATMLSFSHRF